MQEKPTKWGISLITFNLRKRSLSSQIQIPQIVGFGFAQKHAKWGILFDFLQSEEFAVFSSVSDSSDCRIKSMIKATK